MPDFQSDFLASFAATLSSHVDSMLQSLKVGIPHPISEFPFEAGKNAAYVLYSDRGLPMGAGTILASRGVRESARIIKDVEMMGTNGLAASYRLVESESEAVASQVAQIINDLFAVVLPLSSRLGVQDGAGEVAAAPVARRGRPKGAGKGRGTKAAGGGRRGRPRKVQVASELTVGEAPAPRKRGRPAKKQESGWVEAAPRKRGRPAKVQAEAVEEAPRRRGRPRKAEGEVTTTPRRRGRPLADGNATTATKRRGRPSRNPEATAPEVEGGVRAVPKPTGRKRGRPAKADVAPEQTEA